MPIDECTHHCALVAMRPPAAACKPLFYIIRKAVVQILNAPGLRHGV